MRLLDKFSCALTDYFERSLVHPSARCHCRRPRMAVELFEYAPSIRFWQFSSVDFPDRGSISPELFVQARASNRNAGRCRTIKLRVRPSCSVTGPPHPPQHVRNQAQPAIHCAVAAHFRCIFISLPAECSAKRQTPCLAGPRKEAAEARVCQLAARVCSEELRWRRPAHRPDPSMDRLMTQLHLQHTKTMQFQGISRPQLAKSRSQRALSRQLLQVPARLHWRRVRRT